MTRGNLRQQLHVQHRVFFQISNQSGETMPPYGVGKIAAKPYLLADKKHWGFEITKPDQECENDQNAAKLIFNTERPIRDGSRGWGSMSLPAEALLGESVAFGQWVGPIRSQWHLKIGGLTHLVFESRQLGTSYYGTLADSVNPGANIETIGAIASGASGEAKIRYRASGTLVDSALKVKAFNDSPASIEAVTKAQAKLIQGDWCIDVEYCGG